MGLFSKASALLEKQALAFSNFVTKHNIETFAIFALEDNYYSIVDSYGFDGESIATSKSTKDFWDGICFEEKQVYNFTCYNKTLNPILQFFSLSMKDIINTVSLYKTEDKIFMLCNIDITKDIEEDLSKINTQYTDINTALLSDKFINESLFLKYEINFDEAIDNFIISLKDKVDNSASLKTSLFNELTNRFSCNICKYATKRISNNSIRVLFSIDKQDENAYLFSMIGLLKPILSDSAELINFRKVGIAHSMTDIKKFFQVE